MRPAIYLMKERGKIISLMPSMFGLTRDAKEVKIGLCAQDFISIEGPYMGAVLEQARAMTTGAETVPERLSMLMRGRAEEVLDKLEKGIKEDQVAMVWPDGGFRYVSDEGIDEDTDVIGGVDLGKEGVFTYGYKELHSDDGDMREGYIADLAQNFVDYL